MEIAYFAWIRERIGVSREQVEPPPEIADVAGLVDWLAARSEDHAAALSDRSRLRVAVNDCFAGLDAPIAGAREVALFPPVTGG